MTDATHVWLANPATGDKWECPNDEAVLAYYRARGWTDTEAPVEDDEVPVVQAEPAPKRKTRTNN